MKQSGSSYGDWLAKIGAGIGFFLLLINFTVQLLNLAQNSQGLRVISFAAFLVYLVATFWLAFKATAISPRWRWANLGIFYVVTILYFIWVGTWFDQAGCNTCQLAPRPTNLSQRFDFENGLPASVSLGVCDGTKPDWYNYCHDSPNRLKVVSDSFTGQKSLECQVEILPDKEQVYSLRFPIEPPAFTDAVSAHVYSSGADLLSKITLAARAKGENVWTLSDPAPRKDGWLYLLTDLQPFKGNSGTATGEIAVDEIHLDMFVKKGNQASQENRILVDDIELYYPLANSSKAITQPAATSTPVSPALPTQSKFQLCRTDFQCAWSSGPDSACRDTIDLPSSLLASHVLISMTQKARENYGYSLWEVKVFSGTDNLALTGTARASSSEDLSFADACQGAQCAIDDDMRSRWASDRVSQGDRPQTFEIILNTPTLIDRLELEWEAAYAKDYCVTID